jgi:transmembrane sensor
MDKDYKEKLIIKYLNNQCSDEELEEVAGLFKETEGEKELLEIFTSALGSTEPILEINQYHNNDIWNKIKAETKPEIKQLHPNVRKFHTYPLFRAASVLLFIICVTFVLTNTLLKETERVPVVAYHTKESPLGSKAVLTFPDGSVAYLNAGTKITYPSVFTGNTREISLTGEAFFEIKRNEEKPFIIKSNDVYTKVLGTSFNLSSYENEPFELTLATGKVEVSAYMDQRKDSIIIYPNEQVLYDKNIGVLSAKKVAINAHIAWKEGTLVLKGDLPTVAKKIERWYNKKIVIEKGLEKCKIDAVYQNEHLNNVLKGLGFILDLECKITGDTIYLKGKGC